MPAMTDSAFDLAWTHSQVTLRQLDATEREAQLYGRLAGALRLRGPRPPRRAGHPGAATGAARAACGATAFRAMRRWSWSASAIRKKSKSSAS